MNALQNEFVEFSTGKSMKHPSGRDLYLVAAGCHEWSWPIVEEVMSQRWLGSTSGNLRKNNWNLGMVVGAVVDSMTRDNFSWDKVSAIIERAGLHKVSLSQAEIMGIRFPLSLNKFSYYEDDVPIYNMKELSQKMAKTALWLEVISFLLLKNCDLLLSN